MSLGAQLMRKGDHSIAGKKQELRTSMRAARDALPAQDREAAAAHTAEHVARYLETLRPTTVALYSAIRTELDSAPLIATLGERPIRLVFPRVLNTSPVLEFRAAQSLEQLAPGNMGILEPTTDLPLVPVHEVDCFVVPGLAFDCTGTRLGWGGGYYDQTLIHHPSAPRIGLCYSLQILESLPRDERDVPMTAIASEQGIALCSR